MIALFIESFRSLRENKKKFGEYRRDWQYSPASDRAGCTIGLYNVLAEEADRVGHVGTER